MPLAPILVSVYNRLNHLKKTINALKKNDLALESNLFVVSDGAASLADEKIIQEIRTYIQQIEGFNTVTLIARSENWGMFKSIMTAYDQILNTYGKIIFLEDDIITSQTFLQYINDGLAFYKNDNNIFSIHGYCYPLPLPSKYKQPVFLYPRYNAWGVGTWKNRWDKVDFKLNSFEDFLKNKNQVKKFLKNDPRALDVLKTYKHAVDAICSFHMFQNNLYSIYPTESKTINIGFDGSGQSAIKQDVSEQELAPPTTVIFPNELKLNPLILKSFRSYFGFPTTSQRAINKLKRFLTKAQKL